MLLLKHFAKAYPDPVWRAWDAFFRRDAGHLPRRFRPGLDAGLTAAAIARR